MEMLNIDQDEALPSGKIICSPDVYEALGKFLMRGVRPAVPVEERTPIDEVDTLIGQFARALKEKLIRSEAKYGWNNGWMKMDWQDDLRRDLRLHVEKGDPLDVAAYCAFAWHHGWSTASKPVPERTSELEQLMGWMRGYIRNNSAAPSWGTNNGIPWVGIKVADLAQLLDHIEGKAK